MEELVPLTENRPWKVGVQNRADGTVSASVEILLPIGAAAEYPDAGKLKKAMARLADGLGQAWQKS